MGNFNVSYIPTSTQELVQFSEVSRVSGDLQSDDATLSKKRKKKNNIDFERWMKVFRLQMYIIFMKVRFKSFCYVYRGLVSIH